MRPQSMRNSLKLLLSIWVGQPATLEELEEDFKQDIGFSGFSVNGEARHLIKEGLIEQGDTDTFSLSRDGRRHLAGRLRALVDSSGY